MFRNSARNLCHSFQTSGIGQWSKKTNKIQPIKKKKDNKGKKKTAKKWNK